MRLHPSEYRQARFATYLHSTYRGKQTMNHTPVMVSEVLRYLLHDDSKTILDGTVGAGGHSQAILDANPQIQIIAVDRDPTALQIASDHLARYGTRVRLVRGLYSDLPRVLEESGSVDGVFLDLGVSSMQLDESARGFSHGSGGPLDMRMGPDVPTAKEWIESNGVDELALVLRRFGEIRRAKMTARKIKEAAHAGTMNTTADLRAAVERVHGAGAPPSVLSRVFQALRIRVNSELDILASFLERVLDVVNRSGRIVIISYHSLEDRAVKSFFRTESSGCLCPPGTPVCVCGHTPRVRVLTRRVVKSSAAEIEKNPRSRSARLRAVEVIG